MSLTKCIIKDCARTMATAAYRGMCLVCYSAAKKAVEAGKTTWDELEQLELALPAADANPFTKALNEARKPCHP